MFGSTFEARLAAIETRLSAIERGQNLIFNALLKLIPLEKLNMRTLDDVLALVAQQTTLEASVKTGLDTLNTHIADLQAQLTAAQSAQPLDQAKVDQIADALTASNTSLAALMAVDANTPAPAETA